MNSILRVALVLVLAFGVAEQAIPHGDPVPQRGGVLQSIDEMDFELVIKSEKIDLYVSDDGAELSSENMSGTLTIVTESGKEKVDLKPAGINRLRASNVTAASGSRVIAIVKLADGKSMAIQFAIP
jgi:hypothetical protein